MDEKKGFIDNIKENIVSYLVIAGLAFILSQFTNYLTTSNRITAIETSLISIKETIQDINIKTGTTDAKVATISEQLSKMEGKLSIILAGR